MKTLVLMRHAKALQAEAGEMDFNRNLADRGKHDASEMGKRLHKKSFQPDLIIASSANRTLKTAKIVAHELGYDEHLVVGEQDIYEAGVFDVLRVIRNTPDEVKKMILVGHNPTITGLVGYLSNQLVEHVPTAGVALITFDVKTWHQISAGIGKLNLFDAPKNSHK
jgi:phosphohistidine phosphatase